MQFNETEKKNIMDEGMLTRSLIEAEVAMKKCGMYSEMASDPSVKAFFKDQSKGLQDALSYLRSGLSDLK